MSQSRISNSTAISTIIVATLGSGITLMPAVYNTLGVLNGNLVMIFVGVITYISLYSLAYAAKMSEFKKASTSDSQESSFSYSEIAESFSKKLKTTVSVTLVISSYATAFSFVQTLLALLFQAFKFIPSFEKSFDPVNNSFNYQFLKVSILFALALVYFPLFKLESLSSLDFFSKLSLGTALLFSFTVFGYGIFGTFSEKALELVSDSIKLATQKDSIPKMSIGDALGSLIFALHCQFSFPEILSSMQNQALNNFSKVTLVATVLATILYSLVGYLGYLAFGNAIGDGALVVSFGQKDSPIAIYLAGRFAANFGVYVPRVIQTIYIAIFFSGIIFNIYSVLPILQNAFSFNGKPASRTSTALFSSLFVFASGLVEFKNLGTLFGFIGFLFTTPLSFLYPALFVVLSTKQMNTFKIISYSMIILSLTIMIGLFLTTLKIVEF